MRPLLFKRSPLIETAGPGHDLKYIGNVRDRPYLGGYGDKIGFVGRRGRGHLLFSGSEYQRSNTG